MKPHELAQLLGWTIKKVFRWLEEGRIPCDRIEQHGKSRFFSSPSAIREWIKEKGMSISPSGLKLLSSKLDLERAHLERLAHRKMIRTTREAERYLNLEKLREEQARLFASLMRSAA
ncbi:MAG: hypothetical protein LLG20_25010 [Acidobacteriales bacterium]|nr:hypothetical protein [Terriglobales bacterium]